MSLMKYNPFPGFDAKTEIRRYLGGLIGYCLMISGLTKRAKQRVLSSPLITPLYFHNPSKENFGNCVKWLKENGYVFISSDELVGIQRDGMPAPRGAVWVSFDDGWKENIDNVIPTILKYDIPVTFFISTDPVEHSGVFWWSMAKKYAMYLPPPYNNDLRKLWKVSEGERIKAIGELEQRILIGCAREAMTVEDVAYLSDIPKITIGCHTVHHVITPNCTDSELEFEIRQSKTSLEDWTGKPVKFFSYPNGDFTGRERKILQKYGFELSATIEKRFVSAKDDLYSVPRFSVPDNAFFPEALCRLLGVFNPFITIGKILGMAP